MRGMGVLERFGFVGWEGSARRHVWGALVGPGGAGARLRGRWCRWLHLEGLLDQDGVDLGPVGGGAEEGDELVSKRGRGVLGDVGNDGLPDDLR
jgi:hypothetical protein